jgi:hypothetical protein
VLIGEMFRYQQAEHQVNGLLVDGIEIDATLELGEGTYGTYGTLTLVETAMGQRYPMAQTGAA